MLMSNSCDLFALICIDLNIKANMASARYKHVHMTLISTTQISLCSQKVSCYSSEQKTTVNLRVNKLKQDVESVWPWVSGPTIGCILYKPSDAHWTIADGLQTSWSELSLQPSVSDMLLYDASMADIYIGFQEQPLSQSLYVWWGWPTHYWLTVCLSVCLFKGFV